MAATKLKTKTVTVDTKLDLVWGEEAIGLVLGRSLSQTHHMLVNRQLPMAKKVNHRWVASRAALRKFFEAEEEAA